MLDNLILSRKSILKKGDRILGIVEREQILHIPKAEVAMAENAVTSAEKAFLAMAQISDIKISDFFDLFAKNLMDSLIWEKILKANHKDEIAAMSRGKSPTRLGLNQKIRQAMINGLAYWRDMKPTRGKVIKTVRHKGWKVEEVISPYGIIGFVFEARPNVFADAAGVLKNGNTCVLRIGGDALETAKIIMKEAIKPALAKSGMPLCAISLLESTAHSSAWALMTDKKLGLAVIRGSGATVKLLGSIAKQHGIPVSAHGTGGAWMIVDQDFDKERLYKAVYHSLDRKVCNTVNTICVHKKRAKETIKIVLGVLESRAKEFGHGYKIHATDSVVPYVPKDAIVKKISENELYKEWEWEKTPEVSLTVIEAIEEGISLFNKYSPRFVVSLISNNKALYERFFSMTDAPFVGDGFTRWVDGQFAYQTPELGLSNYELGRILGRGAILSGDNLYTVRLRMRQEDEEVCR